MSRPPPIPKRPPRPATPVELRDAIRDEALRLGFDAVGFAPASLAPEARRERLQRLAEFVEAGWQGDMGWLGERTEARADPQHLWQDARTVVSLALNYAPSAKLVESKSLKLYLGSFRNHADFHEACTLAIGQRLAKVLAPRWLRIGGYWYPRGGMPIDVFWQTGQPPKGLWLPDPGVAGYRGRG